MTNDNPIKLPTYIEVPAIKKDAMAGNGPFKASKDIQQSLGFPGEKVDNWQQVAIDKIAEKHEQNRSEFTRTHFINLLNNYNEKTNNKI